jgi:hypothetical protein
MGVRRGRRQESTVQSEHDRVRDRYNVALSALVEQVRQDRAILAVLLGGSLSYDRVWEKSDIDLVLVTIDDRKVGVDSLCLDADGVNVHAMLMPRTEFRRTVEGSLRNSFMHAFLARARLVYSHDPSIAALCATLAGLGQRDQQVQLLRAGISALPAIDKAHKWLITRADLDYTALWILYAATSLAQVEVIGAGRLADREVIPQALVLNPAFFRIVYTDLLNARKTREGVESALRHVDDYVAARAPQIFGAVIDHLRDVREARSCREIEDHFTRHADVRGVTTACEYLADRRLIGRAGVATRLTRRSSVDVQEMAFYAFDPR